MININSDLINAIDARYYELGGDYFGLDDIKMFANCTLNNGFVGSIAEFIEEVASDLRQND